MANNLDAVKRPIVAHCDRCLRGVTRRLFAALDVPRIAAFSRSLSIRATCHQRWCAPPNLLWNRNARRTIFAKPASTIIVGKKERGNVEKSRERANVRSALDYHATRNVLIMFWYRARNTVTSSDSVTRILSRHTFKPTKAETHWRLIEATAGVKFGIAITSFTSLMRNMHYNDNVMIITV